MALFLTEDEGKKLNKNQIKIPDNIVKLLKIAKGAYGQYKKSDGYKRLNSMLDDDYNKRSNKKDRIHNGDKTVSFSNLKRIDHDIRHMPQTKNNLEYNMLGGDETRNWVHDALNRQRTAVKQNKKVPQVPKLEKQKVVKPDVRKTVKVGGVEASVNEDKDKTIFISESQMQKLYEYHNQLKLPFKNGQEIGYDYKENWENFVDFLEEIGKYGTLPKSEWGMKDIEAAIEGAKDEAYAEYCDQEDNNTVFIEAFDDLIGECNTAEKIYTFAQHIPEEVAEEILKNNYAGRRATEILIDYDLLDPYPEENDIMYFLTDNGREAIEKYVVDVFISQYENNGVPYSFEYDNRGLVYVERMITIPKYNKDRFKHMGHNDFYRYLKAHYNGVGSFWTWCPGNSDAYCANSYSSDGDTQIILKGYVDPKDIEWTDTLLKNAYGLNYEQEIEINDGAIIEVDRIELYTYDKSMDGKSLINKPMLLPV